MTFSYGPYSSGGGSSLTDAEWGEFGKALLGTGVIKGALIAGSAGNDFAVTAPGSGMTVNVGTGQAMAYGHWCENDASSSQAISAADPTNPRIDRVVLRHDVTAKTVSIVVLAGTAAPSPSAPTLTQTPSTWELSLCQVAVGAGVSAISSGNITDERTYAVPSNAAALTGAAFTGNISTTGTISADNGTVSTDGAGGLNLTGANKGLEIGSFAASNTPFVDFHSSGNSIDYDSRLVASGGSGSSGQGTLNIVAAALEFNGAGVASAGTHNSVTPLKLSAGTSLPGTLDANEIFFLLS